jgi:hypothetical protein
VSATVTARVLTSGWRRSRGEVRAAVERIDLVAYPADRRRIFDAARSGSTRRSPAHRAAEPVDLIVGNSAWMNSLLSFEQICFLW